MAGTATTDFQHGAPFYLDPNQQDLLLAALSSNNQNPNDLFTSMEPKALDDQQFQYQTDPGFFASPQSAAPATTFSSIGVEESPFAEYLDGDTSFDTADGDLMIGGLPGDTSEPLEKRKNPGDEDDDDEGGGKRREGEDKQAKKPGRKPLTSEPTTKRKAQNRAAQRAFRERKEKHLKDLETKVEELEKASDVANQENGLLRAQVQRLQVELREYRKRISLNSTGVSRSNSLMGGFGSLANGSGLGANSFHFEFPRFGGVPGTHILDNGPLSKNKTVPSPPVGPFRQNSAGRSLSPTSNVAGSVIKSPEKVVVSPSAAIGRSGSVGSFSSPKHDSVSTDASGTPARVFQFNSGSSTHSDSPSASSNSAIGQNSSCDTSPEPCNDSPNHVDSIADGYVCHGNSEGEITFCEKLNMACGNPRNPIPRALSSQSDAKSTPAGSAKAPAFDTIAPPTDTNGLDFFASQNGGQFDPALFGEYRDSQTAIVGDGDFTNGFFNDAFPLTDYGSPFHFGDTPAVQKPNPLEAIERIQDGGDENEVVPGEDTAQMLNCHKIWDKLANRADFKDGTIDIDNLCSELRAKARCSESGVVVDHKDVEAALQRLPKEQ